MFYNPEIAFIGECDSCNIDSSIAVLVMDCFR